MKKVVEKAPKKTNSSTLVSKAKKDDSLQGRRSTWRDEYFDCLTLKQHPVTDAFLERFSNDLILWAKKEDSLVLEDFMIEKGMGIKTFYRFAEKYEELKHANEFAVMALAARREKGGLKNQLNAAMVLKSMPMYSQRWKDLIEWNAKMSEGSNAPSTVIVQMEPFKAEISKPELSTIESPKD